MKKRLRADEIEVISKTLSIKISRLLDTLRDEHDPNISEYVPIVLSALANIVGNILIGGTPDTEAARNILKDYTEHLKDVIEAKGESYEAERKHD